MSLARAGMRTAGWPALPRKVCCCSGRDDSRSNGSTSGRTHGRNHDHDTRSASSGLPSEAPPCR